MTQYNIGIIAGDGIGPEVVEQADKVLAAAEDVYGFKLNRTPYPIGGEYYKQTGEALPGTMFDEMKTQDSLLLGAIGHPDVAPGILEKGILLTMRFEMDLYINLRPIKLYPGVEGPLAGKGPEDIDFVIVRENTEGLYVGAGGTLHQGTEREVAIQESINTYASIRRCLEYSFELAAKRPVKKLTMVAKTNVLNYSSALWFRVFQELAPDYPDVEIDYNHVDAAGMWLIKSPEYFSVLVTDNLFGDILSDAGAIIAGGLGLAAGGNIRPGACSMFEPIGGSAPKYTGLDVANPLATILSAGLLMDHLGQPEAARAIEKAVMDTIPTMDSMSAGKMGAGTAAIGDRVAEAVRQA